MSALKPTKGRLHPELLLQFNPSDMEAVGVIRDARHRDTNSGSIRHALFEQINRSKADASGAGLFAYDRILSAIRSEKWLLRRRGLPSKNGRWLDRRFSKEKLTSFNLKMRCGEMAAIKTIQKIHGLKRMVDAVRLAVWTEALLLGWRKKL